MYNNLVAKSYLSIFWRLRYLEWIFLTIHILLLISGEREGNLLLNFVFYSIFFILSLLFPLEYSKWQKQSYIFLSMLLIVSANFMDISLDLLIYLYIAKSFFLLGYKNTLFSTIVMGIAWVSSEIISEIKELEQGFRFEPPFGFGSYSLGKIAIYSSGIYIAASAFIILFSSVVLAEYESRKRAEALAEQVEILAADLERTRIARDIHDSLGHTLTNLDVQLKVAKKFRDQDLEKAFLALDTAIILSSQCIEDVSHAVKTMRHSKFNLNNALTNLMEQMRSNQAIKIQWEINLPELPIATNHQIYCIVKEGLINIQKHARADSVYFQGKVTSNEIILQLKDDGIGFDLRKPNSGSGLQGMKERIQSLSGQLNIKSSQNQGTQILAIIPQ